MKLLNMGGPQDFMALLVRRKWWILIPFLTLSCAAMLLAYMLPKVFVSQALILIQPSDVPSDLVRNLIAGTTEERLSAIQQQVLSRTNLVELANHFEEQLPEYKNLNMDEKVAKIGRQIGFAFHAERNPTTGQMPVTSFNISYQNANPELAQKIAKSVMDLFIQKDNETRETQVNGTTKFFQDEVNKLADELTLSDAKYKNLKSRRQYELPAQLESNLRGRETATIRRQGLSTDLLFQRQQLSHYEDRIHDIPETIPKPVGPAPPSAVVDVNPNITDYRKKLAERKALISNGATEKNPDVLRVDIQLDRLKKDMSPADLILAQKVDKPEPTQTAASVEMMPNPAYKNLANDIDTTKLSIKTLQDYIDKADQEIATYSKRIENEPQGEQELQDIVRQNDELNKRYQEMNVKLSDSKLSESLESHQKGAQFKVLDYPNLPQSPTKPQKYMIAALGTLISLLAGIALGVIVDVANQKMWTLSDVEALLGATVLVEIPEIVTPSDILESRKKRIRNIASLLAVTAAYGVGLYVVFLHQGYVLRHLDPYIQTFYK